MLGLTLAVILSFVLSPVVNFLQRLRLWRTPAVIVTVLAALVLLGLVDTVIGSQAASQSTNTPECAKTIQQKVSGVQSFAVEELGSNRRCIFGMGRGKLLAIVINPICWLTDQPWSVEVWVEIIEAQE